MKKLTCILTILTCILTFSSCGSNNSSNPQVSTETTESTITSKIEITTESEELTTEAQKCTDMELLTIENHPTFYGSTEKAHEVWDEFSAEDTVMIKSIVGHSNTYERAILVLDCFKGRGAYQKTGSDIVNGVYIRFNNFIEEKEVEFQEALSIVSEYFPYEIMSEHYNLFESCYQNIGTEEEPYYKYFINYKLNDESCLEYDNDYPYDIWVSVVFNVDSDDNVDSISISPRRTSDARFEPEKIEWGYDFLSN